jgi:hypothetical protein
MKKRAAKKAAKKAAAKRVQAWFEQKVAELKAELEKLPADRQEAFRRELPPPETPWRSSILSGLECAPMSRRKTWSASNDGARPGVSAGLSRTPRR